MPYYTDRKLISWLAPVAVHDVVEVVARREDRNVSNYLRRLISKDLRDRGIMSEDGRLLVTAEELKRTAEENQHEHGDDH